MARINTALLVAQVIEAAHHADAVRREPAVNKLGHQAWADLKRTTRTICALVRETKSAWVRTSKSAHCH